jgi:preprotein translocase subunit YajC
LNLRNFLTALAADTANTAGAGGESGSNPLLSMLLMILPIGLIFYVMIIRPEKKRRREMEQKLNSLKVKDRVVTIGGMFGTIVEIEKDEVVLLVDPRKDVKLRYRRSAIDHVVSEEDKSAKSGEEKDKEKK